MIFRNPTINEINRLTKVDRIHTKYLKHLANYFTWFAVKLKLTPNQLTYFWTISQFLTPLLLLTKNYYWMLAAVLLYQILFVFDLSDGKLSRYYLSQGFKPKKTHMFACYIDRIAHIVNGSFFFICLGFAIEQYFFGLLAAYFLVLYRAISLNPSWYRRDEQAELIRKKHQEFYPRHNPNKLKMFVFNLIRVESLFSLVFWLMLFKQTALIIPLYLVIFGLELIRRTTKQLIFVWRLDNK